MAAIFQIHPSRLGNRRLLAILAPFIIACLVILLILGHAQALAAPSSNHVPAPPAPQDPDAILGDIQIQAKVDQEKVRPGSHLVFTILYTNTLGVQVNDVIITATLSKGQSYDGNFTSSPAIPPAQFTWSGTSLGGFALRWELGSLAAGAKGSIVVATDVMADQEPSLDKPIILMGCSTKIASLTQPQYTGSSDDIVSMVTGPVLELDKTATPNPVMPGYRLTYTLTVNNINRADSIAATNMVISDAMPEYTAFLSASPGGFLDGTRVTWNRPGPLLPGSTETVTFTVLVNPNTKSNTEIKNLRTEYHVRSSEITLTPVKGKRDYTVKVDSLLKKFALADRMSGPVALAYPGDEVIYTWTVFNPLNMDLYNVIVTDTLPGIPDPFTYLRPAYDEPAPNQIKDNGRNLVWVIDYLAAWSSASRSFVVQVPRNTFIDPNQTSKSYKNTLSASNPAVVFTTENQLAEVKVEAPVTMNKTVSPNHGMNGDLVYYSVTLSNRGPATISSIRLTDTIEGGFYYSFTVSGPSPLPEYSNNPIVWDGLAIQPGETIELAFAAVIEGNWLTTYYNNLGAYTPDTYIPSRTRIAGVLVDPPLGIDKSVSPAEVSVGDYVDYYVELTNHSEDENWTFDQLKDYLPYGMTQVGGAGGNPAVIDVVPAYTLAPGGVWTGSFRATVNSNIGCSQLPKTFPNTKGMVQVHLTAPQTFWAANAVDLAPLKINPNLLVDLIPYRQTLLRGDIFTYTLVITNAGHIDVPTNNFELEIPEGVNYRATLNGPVPTVNSNRLIWSGLSFAPGDHLVVDLQMQVNTGAALGDKTPNFSGTTTANACVGKLGTGFHPYGEGKITVADPVIKLEKKTNVQQVPPLTLIEYELKMENKDAYPFKGVVVTDTMPNGFTYHSMLSGPNPQVKGSLLVWKDIELPPKRATNWKVRLQSSPLYFTYQNKLRVYTPETVVNEVQDSPGVTVAPLFSLSKIAGAQNAKPGDVFTYTIALVNNSKSTYSSIRITDTLPTGFSFVSMLPGFPWPITTGPNNGQPIWDGITINGNCQTGCIYKLTFQVRVGNNAVVGINYNTIIGYSPSGSIPGPIQTAPVTITQGTIQPTIYPNYVPLIQR